MIDDLDMLRRFVAESNHIEGIDRGPTAEEINAHVQFLSRHMLTIAAVQMLVAVVQPDAVLRDKSGLNVRVGSHHPPVGGPYIPVAFTEILHRAQMHRGMQQDIYRVHQDYEALHPFTDGNGRSGRALWLWMMGGAKMAPLGFLHSWYYQSLQFGGNR